MTSLRYLRIFIRLFAGVFFFIFTLNLSAQSKRDLTKDSPFLPPGYRQHLEKKNKKPPPPPKAPPKLRQNLELRGYFRLGGVWRFSVFDKRTNKSQWIILNDRDRNDGIYSLNLITRMVAYRLSKMVTKNPYPYPVHLGTHCPSPI